MAMDPVMTSGRLLDSALVIPPKAGSTRQSTEVDHPIWNFRSIILTAIKDHQFLIISGDTGSGKTTQVPQYIIEDAYTNQQHCKIICSMPRRVAAVGVSERVAFERKEPIGNTVGYMIKLDSRVSQKTALTYCTNGVLLRCLLGEIKLENVTHLILDEIHERDKATDIIMLLLKLVIHQYPKLKVILMSATMDITKFQNYFDVHIPVIKVDGTSYNVVDFYLEDILKQVDWRLPDNLNHQLCTTDTLYEEEGGDCEEKGKESLANLPVSAEKVAHTLENNKMSGLLRARIALLSIDSESVTAYTCLRAGKPSEGKEHRWRPSDHHCGHNYQYEDGDTWASGALVVFAGRQCHSGRDRLGLVHDRASFINEVSRSCIQSV
ncbi:3'-5' RNA helicase ythdc2 [Homalodisca vitripennis]|nr:3'-5' RNA helicase ythdc2 [Homalodisca vitripennis]